MSKDNLHDSGHDPHGKHKRAYLPPEKMHDVEKKNEAKAVEVKVEELSPMMQMKEELSRRRDLKDGHTYLSSLVKEVFAGNKAVTLDAVMFMCDVVEQGGLTDKECQALEMVIGQAAHRPQLWEVVESLIKFDRKNGGIHSAFLAKVKEQVKNVLEHPTQYSASRLQVEHMVDRHPELR
jgi:hypothetical protein